MNSKKALKALLVPVLMLICGPALAAKGFSYSYANAGYYHLSGDSDDYDVDGAQVDLSFGVHDLVALRGGYIRGWTDDFPEDQDRSGDPDLNEFRVGLQPHYTFIKKKLDAYGEVIYVNSKFNGDRSNTDIGYIYGGGLRYKAFKRFEIRLGGEYRSGDIDKGFGVVEPVFKLTKKFDLSLRTTQSSDVATYFAGFRLRF